MSLGPFGKEELYETEQVLKEVMQVLKEVIKERDRYKGALENHLKERDRYKKALENHLCKYDLADWLACSGGHGDYCEVCESPEGDHPHKTLKELEAKLQNLLTDFVKQVSETGRITIDQYNIDFRNSPFIEKEYVSKEVYNQKIKDLKKIIYDCPEIE
jgi:hypothetical protein